MAVPAPAGVSRVSVEGTYQTTHWVNVYHVYTPPSGTPSLSDLHSLLDDFVASCAVNLYALMADSSTAVQTVLNYSDGASITQVVNTTPMPGSDSGGQNFGDIAPVISWQGSWHYRGGKPRTYFPGTTTDWISEPGLLDGTRVASLQDGANNFRLAWAATTSSRFPARSLGVLLGATVTAPGTFAPFSGALVRAQPGNQRRRVRNH